MSRCKKCAKHERRYQKFLKNQGRAMDWLVNWVDDGDAVIYDALEAAVKDDESALTVVREMRKDFAKFGKRSDKWWYGHLKNKRG